MRFETLVGMKKPMKILGLIFICCSALFLSVSAASDDESASPPSESNGEPAPVSQNSLMAGAAKIVLTPDVAKKYVSLNGYGDRRKDRATGVMDPIYARAIVLSDSTGETVALIGSDLCYITTPVRDAVIERLRPSGFSQSNVFISATHTHSGYAGYDNCFVANTIMGDYDRTIFEHTVSSIVKVVQDAKASMVPAQLKSSAKEITGFNRSRLDPSFEHGEGKSLNPTLGNRYPTNKKMTLIEAVTKDGKPIACLLHYTAHPTILSPKNMRISADYPGVLYEKLEAEMGAGSVAVFFNGSEGDTAPTPDWMKTVEEETSQMQDYGRRLSGEAIDLMKKLEPMGETRISSNSVREIYSDVHLRPLGAIELPGFLSKAFYTTPEVTFQIVKIGRFVFLAVPGEATTATGKNLSGLCSASETCIVVCPANGYMGYLVTREEYDTDGYESDSCFFGPNAADRVKLSFKRALDGLKVEPEKKH